MAESQKCAGKANSSVDYCWFKRLTWARNLPSCPRRARPHHFTTKLILGKTRKGTSQNKLFPGKALRSSIRIKTSDWMTKNVRSKPISCKRGTLVCIFSIRNRVWIHELSLLYMNYHLLSLYTLLISPHLELLSHFDHGRKSNTSRRRKSWHQSK